MAAPVKPAGVTTYGKISWGWAPTVASLTAPALTDLNATAGLNISCMTFEGFAGVSAETEKVTLTRRYCETDTFQGNGSTTYSMEDFMVHIDPQAAAATAGKKAWETLVTGATGYMWQRIGILATTDLAAGQFVNLFPVEIKRNLPTTTADDASGLAAFMVSVAITGAPSLNVAIV